MGGAWPSLDAKKAHATNMKQLLTFCVVAIAVIGCRSAAPQRPVDAEATGMRPLMDPTQAQYDKLQEQAWRAFSAILGEPLPDTINPEGPTTGWFSKDGKLGQIRAGFKLPRQEFHKRFHSAHWQEIPIPQEYYEPMHLPHNAPKDYMTCYVGHVKRKPAYLLWSDYEEVAMLVLDY